VIALPPLFGAVNVTVICAFPDTTVGCAGAEGIVLGITAIDAGDAGLVPFAFVAVTVHVYDFPFVKPLTTIGEAAPFIDPAVPPFDDAHVTPKPVIALPPLLGAANETVICAFPATTAGCAGAKGVVLGIAAIDAVDGAPSPFTFVAVTVHVYDLPFVRPFTTIGEVGPPAEPAVPPFDDEQFTL
jgi:hypothetical protein